MSLDQWETYYRSGALATCPTAADGGYDRELRQVWVDFFWTLDDGARILDVGTGNGAIALIAAETAAALGRQWEIDATDLARIDPVRDVAGGARRFAGVRFHPGVATERLPFADAAFDAVCGQYALEYSEPPAALAETFRVLRPGCDAQFVVHHAHSALVRSARASLRESELVFRETKVFRRVRKLVTMTQVVPGATERATEELRTAIRTLKQSLEQARATGGGRVLAVALDAVQKLLAARNQLGPDQAGLEVDRAEAGLQAGTRRLNDLVRHARDAAAMAELSHVAATAGFTLIEYLPLHHGGGNLVGWHLMLHRP